MGFDTKESVIEELVLFTENTGRLYPKKQAILRTMERRVDRGTYDATTAATDWLPYVDAGAREYGREFEMDANDAFPPDVRMAAATQIAHQQFVELMVQRGENGRSSRRRMANEPAGSGRPWPRRTSVASEAGAAAPISLDDDALFTPGGSRGHELGRVFAWLTRNGMGPHFGRGIPIGYYQQDQIAAIETIQDEIKKRELSLNHVRVHNGMVEAQDSNGEWRDVMSTTDVASAASRRVQKKWNAGASEAGTGDATRQNKITTAQNITDRQISDLMDEAIRAGDDAMVETCEIALGAGDVGVHAKPIEMQRARARCAEAINDAEAQLERPEGYARERASRQRRRASEAGTGDALHWHQEGEQWLAPSPLGGGNYVVQAATDGDMLDVWYLPRNKDDDAPLIGKRRTLGGAMALAASHASHRMAAEDYVAVDATGKPVGNNPYKVFSDAKNEAGKHNGYVKWAGEASAPESGRTAKVIHEAPSAGESGAGEAYEAHLTKAQRDALPRSAFALPERRELPIKDKRHIKPAASRLSMMFHNGHVTKAEYKSAHKRIERAGRKYGIVIHEAAEDRSGPDWVEPPSMPPEVRGHWQTTHAHQLPTEWSLKRLRWDNTLYRVDAWVGRHLPEGSPKPDIFAVDAKSEKEAERIVLDGWLRKKYVGDWTFEAVVKPWPIVDGVPRAISRGEFSFGSEAGEARRAKWIVRTPSETDARKLRDELDRTSKGYNDRMGATVYTSALREQIAMALQKTGVSGTVETDPAGAGEASEARRPRETNTQQLIIQRATVNLLNGKRLEVHGKGNLIIYLGSSKAERRDPFWYEGPRGRTYKENAEEVVRAILPHVGYEAIDKAVVLPGVSEVGESTKLGNVEGFDSIHVGDRVTIVNRFGQEHSGRAVMRGPHGWVLNMGGRHGTPAVATADNVVKVRHARKTRGAEAAGAREMRSMRRHMSKAFESRSLKLVKGGKKSGMPKMDEFTQQYIATALWSTTDNSNDQGGDPLDKNYGIGDLAPATLAKMQEDAEQFQKNNAALLEKAYEKRGYDESSAGHDFWLTRERHGAGFWDRGLGKVGDKLTDAAHAYGSFDLYVGDDGKIYASGFEGARASKEGQVTEAAEAAKPPAASDGGGFTTVKRDVESVRAGREFGEIKDSRAAYDYLHPRINGSSQEIFFVVCLDIYGKPLTPDPFEVARGQRDRVNVNVEDILRPIIQTNAAGAVVGHLHPSGEANPSDSDKQLHKDIEEGMSKACPSAVLVDDLVIGDGVYYSLVEKKSYKVKT